jgi:Flp pilus assembly protein TadB
MRGVKPDSRAILSVLIWVIIGLIDRDSWYFIVIGAIIAGVAVQSWVVMRRRTRRRNRRRDFANPS